MSLRMYFDPSKMDPEILELHQPFPSAAKRKEEEMEQRRCNHKMLPTDFQYYRMLHIRIQWDDERALPYVECHYFRADMPEAYYGLVSTITGYVHTLIVDHWTGNQLPARLFGLKDNCKDPLSASVTNEGGKTVRLELYYEGPVGDALEAYEYIRSEDYTQFNTCEYLDGCDRVLDARLINELDVSEQTQRMCEECGIRTVGCLRNQTFSGLQSAMENCNTTDRLRAIEEIRNALRRLNLSLS